VQIDVKFQRLAFSIMLSILAFTVISSNVTYSLKDFPELHEKTFDEIIKHSSTKQNPGIPIGRGPFAISVNPSTNTIFVANRADDTVSVINGTSNSRIGDYIPVGSTPSAIAVNPNTNTIYVANRDNDTVSIINGRNNTKIGDDIPVGYLPRSIAVNSVTNMIYVANQASDTVSVIDGTNNTKIGDDITVGTLPTGIGVNSVTNMIYVANQAGGTVSVIDGTNNTKIGDEITVGGVPVAIAVNPVTNMIYVAKFYGGVSVISGTNNSRFGDDITVGRVPVAIDVNPDTNTIYVANMDDDTVSVINGSTNSRIVNDIPVGTLPTGIGVNPDTNTTYVANMDDDTVSVIDGKSNELVAGVTFSIQPFNAGRIECPNGNSPVLIAQEFYLSSDFKCTAKPNQGFEFLSWQENLGGNSTRSLIFSLPSTWDSVLRDSILDFFHMKPDKREATFNITKFGSFTANFKALPPPIPPEYIAALFTVVVTAFVGTWLTPAVIAWRRTKNQREKLNYYYSKQDFYKNRKLNNDDIKKLDNLRNEITNEYTNGKINKEQYDKLVDEISINYKRFFADEVHSLDSLVEIDRPKERLSLLKSNIQDARDEGKINNEYYAYLNKEISIMYKEIFTKKIDSLNDLSEKDKLKELNKIKDDISVAYSKENINELHYSLLKERLGNYEKK